MRRGRRRSTSTANHVNRTPPELILQESLLLETENRQRALAEASDSRFGEGVIQYLGLFLDDQSARKLEEAVPPAYKLKKGVGGYHITITFEPDEDQIARFRRRLLGKRAVLTATHVIDTGDYQGLRVRGVSVDSGVPHITVSWDSGSTPAMGKQVLKKMVGDPIQPWLKLNAVYDTYPRSLEEDRTARLTEAGSHPDPVFDDDAEEADSPEEEEVFSQGSVRMLPDLLMAARLRAQNAMRVLERDPQLALERLNKLQKYMHVFHEKAVSGDCTHRFGVRCHHEDLERRFYRPVLDAIRFLTKAIDEDTTVWGAKQRLRSAIKYLEEPRELEDLEAEAEVAVEHRMSPQVMVEADVSIRALQRMFGSGDDSVMNALLRAHQRTGEPFDLVSDFHDVYPPTVYVDMDDLLDPDVHILAPWLEDEDNPSPEQEVQALKDAIKDSGMDPSRYDYEHDSTGGHRYIAVDVNGDRLEAADLVNALIDNAGLGKNVRASQMSARSGSTFWEYPGNHPDIPIPDEFLRVTRDASAITKITRSPLARGIRFLVRGEDPRRILSRLASAIPTVFRQPGFDFESYEVMRFGFLPQDPRRWVVLARLTLRDSEDDSLHNRLLGAVMDPSGSPVRSLWSEVVGMSERSSLIRELENPDTLGLRRPRINSETTIWLPRRVWRGR